MYTHKSRSKKKVEKNKFYVAQAAQKKNEKKIFNIKDWSFFEMKSRAKGSNEIRNRYGIEQKSIEWENQLLTGCDLKNLSRIVMKM